MTPQRPGKKKRPTSRGRKRLPSKFICIAPDEARHVFDFLNSSARHHEKEIARLHYHLCLHCQEAVAGLASIKQAVSEKLKELVHPGEAYPGSPIKPVGLNNPVQREVQMLATDTELCLKAAGEM